MKKKLFTLSRITLILSLIIFVFSYFMYHYMDVYGHWTTQWSHVPGKPYLTLLFAIWGVMFLFSSVISTLIALIFYSDQ